MFYRNVAYKKQKQAYIFVENNAVVPLDNSNCVIFLEPTKQCFRYNHQTMQLAQVGLDECNWSVRYLLCQDIILHQTVATNDNAGKVQTPD